MNNGFILLHRKIRDNWIYKKPIYFQWFIEFLFKANFKDNNKFLFEGKFLTIKRGQFITSYRQLSKDLPQCSEQKIRTFLNLLIKDNIVLITNLQKATRITILNYESYQGEQHSSNTVATQQQHSSNTVATTIERKKKKDNKENNKIVFNFKKSLLDLNIEKQIVEDWLLVRKNKKATNSITSFNSIKKQIELSGKSASECIKIAVEKDWKGFNAEWLKNSTHLNGTNKIDIYANFKKF